MTICFAGELLAQIWRVSMVINIEEVSENHLPTVANKKMFSTLFS